MKHLIITLLICSSCYCFAQDNSKKTEAVETLIEHVRNNRIYALADMVEYPIRRPNPIPDLETKEDFILYYPVIFDDVFKKLLTTSDFNEDNTFSRHGNLGILNGQIWLNGEGKIITINYNSDQEKQLLEQLHQEKEAKLHPSVSDWNKNIWVLKNEKFTIRIDLMDDGNYRYVSWNRPKSTSEEPDLILFHGKHTFYGTQGGSGYEFRNHAWTYLVEHIRMAEREEDMGYFIVLSKDGETIKEMKMEKVK